MSVKIIIYNGDMGTILCARLTILGKSVDARESGPRGLLFGFENMESWYLSTAPI